MGNSCPLQKAHPLGGKFQLMILISDKNGVDIGPPSGRSNRLLRWKYSEQRKNKIDRQKRNHVIVRLRPTRLAHRVGRHLSVRWVTVIELPERGICPYVTERTGLRAGAGIRLGN